MRALDRKLARDLWRIRTQVLTIALVVASGIAIVVMALGTLHSLRETARAYYERQRFADVFLHLERAPLERRRAIEAISGVHLVETRISQIATLSVEGFEEPIVGQVLSLPTASTARLNRPVLRSGRFPERAGVDEAVLLEPFADAHGLRVGDRLSAVLNGRRRDLEIVGTALSPEFVYAIAPGALIPDEARYGIVWMGREALASAYDLEGAFNEVSLSLAPGAATPAVIRELDTLLGRFGGTGAYDRSEQASAWFLRNEMEQLRNLATILPVIFIAVAAFLTNMVLRRLIAVEKSEIGLLKAFGYSNLQVGAHYIKLVLVIVALGAVAGSLLGVWFGAHTTGMYAEFFRFPFVHFRPDPFPFVLGVAISLGAAGFGGLGAIREAVSLPPAEAMRPPTPARYRRRGAPRRVLDGGFDQASRMVFRHLARWPMRSGLSALGLALSLALLIAALQWIDSIDYLARVHFEWGQRQDLSVSLVEARDTRALREFAHLPGVLQAEPLRGVPVRLRAGGRARREILQAVAPDAVLQPVFDRAGYTVPVPPDGLLLSSELARVLDVSAGDEVTVEVLEGRRPVDRLRVEGLFETFIGTPAYVSAAALQRLLREAPALGGAHLVVDPHQRPRLFAAIQGLPNVSSATLRSAAIEKFHDTMGESVWIFVSVYAAFSGALAFGVAYNSARIGLSERSRELATLRVLGFTRTEVAYILLGELALLAALSLPLGIGLGYGLAWLMAESFATELFRIPVVIEASTLGAAVVATLAAIVVSGASVKRRLDRVDLIAVLKARE